MKRLILFIGFIVLTSTLFAQTWQPSVYEYIQSYSQYELVQHNNPNAVWVVRNGDTSDSQYQNFLKYLTGNHFYSFVKDKKLYMLSYDACTTCYKEPALGNPIKRGLYLFRLDADKWTKVSDVIQTDYYSLDSSIDEVGVPQHEIWSSYCYVPVKNITDDYNNDKSLKNGSVEVSVTGEVTIVLVNRKWRYDDKYAPKGSFENRTITLELNDEFYTIKK
jgi:hypothetical protein